MAWTILTIAVLLFAVFIPLAVGVALVGHGLQLAAHHGGPLGYDIPDATRYWAGRGSTEAAGEQAPVSIDTRSAPTLDA